VVAVGGVRFETLNQAVNGDLVIAGQAHGLALPGKPLAPVRNLAVYEIREGKIAAWRDYANRQKPASFWACSRRTTGRKHP
jgi:limonene-1,2-epoxide hydrolase